MQRKDLTVGETYAVNVGMSAQDCALALESAADPAHHDFRQWQMRLWADLVPMTVSAVPADGARPIVGVGPDGSEMAAHAREVLMAWADLVSLLQGARAALAVARRDGRVSAKEFACVNVMAAHRERALKLGVRLEGADWRFEDLQLRNFTDTQLWALIGSLLADRPQHAAWLVEAWRLDGAPAAVLELLSQEAPPFMFSTQGYGPGRPVRVTHPDPQALVGLLDLLEGDGA